MTRTLILVTILLIGCRSASRMRHANLIAEKNKDVFILSTLIRDHLKRTDGRELNLDELLKNDTLNRIRNNFDSLDLIPRGGYIQVHYKFSKSRDCSKIVLTDAELRLMNALIWKDKPMSEGFDGEIHFAYGERFYHIEKYIVRKK